MSLFKQEPKQRTVFCLGKPEAEAECNNTGLLSLKNLFVDALNAESAMNRDRFIIVGRKGTGKSAIAGFQNLSSHTYDPDSPVYAEVVKVQFGRSAMMRQMGLTEGQEYTYYFQWQIVSKLTKLIIDSKIGQYNDSVKALAKFYNKYFNLFQVNESTDSLSLSELNISVNLLMGKFGASFDKKNRRNDEPNKPFYVFLPGIIDVLATILNFEIYADTQFKLMFDDLDIGFDINDGNQCLKLVSLLRVAKEFNNNPLLHGKLKILVFIRDDVERKLKSYTTDMPKMLKSYSFVLNWYEGPKVPEKKLKLRQILNKRIASNFEAAGITDYDRTDPWKSYVAEHQTAGNSTFKNLLDYTFYRPRDFINLFMPLELDNTATLPLQTETLKSMLKEYSETAFTEIEAEMRIKYTQTQIKDIRTILSRLARTLAQQKATGINYGEFTSLVRNTATPELVDEMYNYDLIGFIDLNGDFHYHFRHSYPTDPVEDCKVTLPNIIRLYFDRSVRIRV